MKTVKENFNSYSIDDSNSYGAVGAAAVCSSTSYCGSCCYASCSVEEQYSVIISSELI